MPKNRTPINFAKHFVSVWQGLP